MAHDRRVLVTGASGFLGQHLVPGLQAKGFEVRAMVRKPDRVPQRWQPEVDVIYGEIEDPNAVAKAVSGCEAVYHLAANTRQWGRTRDFVGPNVDGTRNVVAGALKAGTCRLIHVSSPSVVHRRQNLSGIDESAPLNFASSSAYVRTKALAEALVSGVSKTLNTVILRPHLVWGPGDKALIPTIIDRAKSGRLFRIEGRDPVVDTTYVDNAVAAMLQADSVLKSERIASGRSFFVTNGEPAPIWSLIERVLAHFELAPRIRSVPRSLALSISHMAVLSQVLTEHGRPPLATPFLIDELTFDHWFSIEAARRDLGYEPSISVDQGLEILTQKGVPGGANATG